MLYNYWNAIDLVACLSYVSVKMGFYKYTLVACYILFCL